MGHIRNSLSLLRHYGIKTAVKSELAGLAYNKYTRRKRVNALLQTSFDEKKLENERNHKFNREITISILTPVYNTDAGMLKALIESVINQTYSHFELCLADGSDKEHDYVGKLIEEYAAKDSRIKYLKLEHNGGISENTNACFTIATGDYFALLDHDDVLHPSALYYIAREVDEENADFIYTDEFTFKGDISNVLEVNLKPDFSPDTLRGNNYICHFTAFSRELYNITGGFRKEYDGSQDHDMVLRLTIAATKIKHIPELLYFWRAHEGSVVEDVSAKEYAIAAGRNAVKDSLISQGISATVTSTELYPTIYKINYEIKDNPLVSIIIPNRNNLAVLKKCIDSIRTSTYTNYEIIVIENNSVDSDIKEYYSELQKDNVKVLEKNIEFNYSELNNYGVENAKGDYILFLNNDTEVITKNWIEELLMYAQRDDVGAVGAKLLYANNTVQHCFVLTGMGEDGVAVHAYAGKPDCDAGFLGRVGFCQNVGAVTAACMMVKKSDFEAVCGFDTDLAVAYNDVDLCLKLRKMGKLIVYTPFAKLYHYESRTRGSDTDGAKRQRLVGEAGYMKDKWGDYLVDPYYNPKFSLTRPYELRG